MTGAGAAIGLQVFAQQTPSTTPAIQAQQQVAAPTITTSDAVKADTDNIQDPGGKEQADAPEQDKADTDNIQDPGGKEVPDATSAVADERDHDHQEGIAGHEKQDKNETEDGMKD